MNITKIGLVVVVLGVAAIGCGVDKDGFDEIEATSDGATVTPDGAGGEAEMAPVCGPHVGAYDVDVRFLHGIDAVSERTLAANINWPAGCVTHVHDGNADETGSLFESTDCWWKPDNTATCLWTIKVVNEKGEHRLSVYELHYTPAQPAAN